MKGHIVCWCVRVVWLTGEVGASAVGSQIVAISVGGVTLEQALVPGLHFGDVEHGWVTAQALHVDLFTVHPLGVHSVGIVWLSRAHDADLPIWYRCQIHGPLEVLFHPLLVSRHVAPDGHVGALSPYERSTLHRHHSLSLGQSSFTPTTKQWEKREREKKESIGYKLQFKNLYKYSMTCAANCAEPSLWLRCGHTLSHDKHLRTPLKPLDTFPVTLFNSRHPNTVAAITRTHALTLRHKDRPCSCTTLRREAAIWDLGIEVSERW